MKMVLCTLLLLLLTTDAHLCIMSRAESSQVAYMRVIKLNPDMCMHFVYAFYNKQKNTQRPHPKNICHFESMKH